MDFKKEMSGTLTGRWPVPLPQYESYNLEYVSVTAVSRILPAATASIDRMGNHWWVSRVFVHRDYRRRGLGARCLTRAMELVFTQSSLPIIVSPGGYDTPEEEQRAFYAKHGFVEQGGIMVCAGMPFKCLPIHLPWRKDEDDEREKGLLVLPVPAHRAAPQTLLADQRRGS